MILRLLVLTLLLTPPTAGADERRSGFDDMSAELQQMQTDDFANPGMLWVLEGATLWETPEGASGRACVDCHGDAAESMAGVAARYPAFDEEAGAPVDLEGRINLCRTRHQGAEPLPLESRPLLALSAFVARQSRGLPIVPDPDPRLEPWRARGAELFTTRMGQLNFACAQCHDDNAGERLAAALIPQAHPTGYPQYRLEWQEMGSLDRRLRNCMTGVRAEPWEAGSPEHLALELYLKERAAGMPVEAPAVRP